MPNWCSCQLNISSNNIEDIKNFKKLLNQKNMYGEDTYFSLHPFLPVPLNSFLGNESNTKSILYKEDVQYLTNEVINDTLSKKNDAIIDNIYSWIDKNWSCRECDNGCVQIDEESFLCISFITPWTYPEEWLKNVSKLYPNIGFTIAFSETGCGFYGYAHAKNGELEDFTFDMEADAFDEDGIPHGEYGYFMSEYNYL